MQCCVGFLQGRLRLSLCGDVQRSDHYTGAIVQGDWFRRNLQDAYLAGLRLDTSLEVLHIVLRFQAPGKAIAVARLAEVCDL